MLAFLLNDDGIITNIIVIGPETDLDALGAVTFVDGLSIGDKYTPPKEPPTELEQLRFDVDALTLAMADMIGGSV